MPDYQINLEDRFGSLSLIDVGAEAAAVGDEWVNQTLTTVKDEFFLVLEGELEIEVEDREPFVLGPQQGVTIPRGVMHRPVARKRTVILMVEPATVQPTGD